MYKYRYIKQITGVTNGFEAENKTIKQAEARIKITQATNPGRTVKNIKLNTIGRNIIYDSSRWSFIYLDKGPPGPLSKIKDNLVLYLSRKSTSYFSD